MAKRKGTVALFEVIQKDKRFQRSGGTAPIKGGALQTPKWWFKGKLGASASSAAPEPAPAQESAFSAATAIFRRKIEPGARATTPSVPAAPTASKPLNPTAIEQNASDSWPVVHQTADGFAPLRRGKSPLGPGPMVWLRQWAPLLTPASAGIILLALVTAATLAVGWSYWQRRESVAAILHGPAHPEVLDVGDPRPVTASIQTSTPTGLSQSAMPAAATQLPRRIVNHDYVLIHYYGTAKAARLVADYFNQHGLPCTVEHGIAGVSPHFYVVVGVTPFAHKGTADYVAYVQQIKNLLKDVPGGSPTIKSFAPTLIKWSEPQTTARAE